MQALYRDHMGNDLSVVQDARISFDASSSALEYEVVEIPNRDEAASQKYANIPVLKPADERLIQFLARGCRSGQWATAINEVYLSVVRDQEIDGETIERVMKWVKNMPTHWTPFGHQIIKLRMKAPVPIRTQCFKHKIGFVENEESRRYISSTPELFIPEFRSAPEGDIKQGSGGIHPNNENFKKQYEIRCLQQIQFYEELIAKGVAPEQARFVLPQGVFVNWVWTGSLYAYAELFNKRTDRNHAQHEIADLIEEAGKVIEVLFPVSWGALTQ